MFLWRVRLLPDNRIPPTIREGTSSNRYGSHIANNPPEVPTELTEQTAHVGFHVGLIESRKSLYLCVETKISWKKMISERVSAKQR